MSDRRDPDVHRLVMDWPDDAIAEIERLRSRLAGMEAAWRNACERGDKAVARLAEVEALLRRHRKVEQQFVQRCRDTLLRLADSASEEGNRG